MNIGLSSLMAFWLLYSAVTIYGIVRFPAYDAIEKTKRIVIVVCIPIYGAYLTNKNMKHRFSEAAKKDAAYELQWWCSLTLPRSSSTELEDD